MDGVQSVQEFVNKALEKAKVVGVFNIKAAEIEVPKGSSFTKILELQEIGCIKRGDLIIQRPGTKGDFKFTLYDDGAGHMQLAKDLSETQELDIAFKMEEAFAVEVIPITPCSEIIKFRIEEKVQDPSYHEEHTCVMINFFEENGVAKASFNYGCLINSEFRKLLSFLTFKKKAVKEEDK